MNQIRSVTQSRPTFVTPWIAACQTSLSITNSRSSLRLTSIESVMPSSHLIRCRPLFLLLPIPPSIRVFSNESTLRMRWPKYWSFSFSIIPSKKNPRADLLQNGLVGSPCSPRDSQESSLTPQFTSVNSLGFSLLLMRVYLIPGTAWGSGDVAMKEVAKSLPSWVWHSNGEKEK